MIEIFFESYQQIYTIFQMLKKHARMWLMLESLRNSQKKSSISATEYEFVDVICIRLAHKHWESTNSQIILETEGIYKGREARIIKPTNITAIKKKNYVLHIG